ncbi:MAG TPA: hypothetical protein VHY37_03670 [Tepidisphaeraceae bacterium]|nr:hypothetical protein [Tepidisphaeraceae bacterium]
MTPAANAIIADLETREIIIPIRGQWVGGMPGDGGGGMMALPAAGGGYGYLPPGGGGGGRFIGGGADGPFELPYGGRGGGGQRALPDPDMIEGEWEPAGAASAGGGNGPGGGLIIPSATRIDDDEEGEESSEAGAGGGRGGGGFGGMYARFAVLEAMRAMGGLAEAQQRHERDVAEAGDDPRKLVLADEHERQNIAGAFPFGVGQIGLALRNAYDPDQSYIDQSLYSTDIQDKQTADMQRRMMFERNLSQQAAFVADPTSTGREEMTINLERQGKLDEGNKVYNASAADLKKRTDQQYADLQKEYQDSYKKADTGMNSIRTGNSGDNAAARQLAAQVADSMHYSERYAQIGQEATAAGAKLKDARDTANKSINAVYDDEIKNAQNQQKTFIDRLHSRGQVLGDQLTGDTDDARRAGLEQQIGELSASALKEGGASAKQYVTDTIAPEMRQKLERDIAADRGKESVNSSISVEDTRAGEREAAMRAGGNTRGAEDAAYVRGLDDRIAKLRAEADAAVDDSQKQKELQAQLDAMVGARAGLIASHTQDENIKDAEQVYGVRSATLVATLRAEQRNYEASEEAAKAHYEVLSRLARANHNEALAQALEDEEKAEKVQRDAGRQRETDNVNESAAEQELRNAGQGRLADVYALQHRMQAEIDANKDDPARQAALARQGAAEAEAMIKGMGSKYQSFGSDPTALWNEQQKAIFNDAHDAKALRAAQGLDRNFKAEEIKFGKQQGGKTSDPQGTVKAAADASMDAAKKMGEAADVLYGLFGPGGTAQSIAIIQNNQDQ